MGWINVPFREAAFWTSRLDERRTEDGTIYLRQQEPLADCRTRITDPLFDGARAHGDRVFLADRVPGQEGWRRVTYGQMADHVRRAGTWLLRQGLSVERPLLILSGNSIEHATLALAAIHVGIPHASITPNYSLMGGDYGRLHDVMDGITPGMAFAADGAAYRPAMAAVAPELPFISVTDVPGAISYAGILETEPTGAVEAAHEKITRDTVAKFLFTSGSTGTPKAVPNTHRMICAAQEMNRETFVYLKDEPPVILDWSPWNHTAGGNSVFFMTLFNGGTLYIDDGKPTPEGMKATIRNLHEVSPTWYFNVPVGWDALVPALRVDAALRESLFRDLKLVWYAGASLTQATWNAIETLAVETLGKRVRIGTGLGSTETAPGGLTCTLEQSGPGNVGLPVPGTELKLVPVGGGKYDARIKGPNVMPGYWRQPEVTARVFDEEGFYMFGDALEPVDPDDMGAGFRFAGRTAENFKLDTGTWVSTGNVRHGLLEALGGAVRDVVLTGPDRPYLGALLFLNDPAKSGDPALHRALKEGLSAHARAAKGSSERVRRVLVLHEGPSVEAGEVTEKGSINQRAVIASRPGAVEALYAGRGDIIEADLKRTPS